MATNNGPRPSGRKQREAPVSLEGERPSPACMKEEGMVQSDSAEEGAVLCKPGGASEGTGRPVAAGS